MTRRTATLAAQTLVALALLLPSAAYAQTSPYPRMAPLAQYQMPRDTEIAMARTAAPASISAEAEILVMEKSGYEVAVPGKNGFVCMVLRSFAAAIDAPEFWNPKIRGPICLNPEGIRSWLPHVRMKAEWALAGLSTAQMADRIKAALAGKQYPPFEPGAMSYMMSKDGYLSDDGGHWHPHLMFFVAATDAATWGANLPGSPVLASPDVPEHYTIFLIPVGRWSDGTSAQTKD
jgi:hypothetical protein